MKSAIRFRGTGSRESCDNKNSHKIADGQYTGGFSSDWLWLRSFAEAEEKHKVKLGGKKSLESSHFAFSS